MLLGCLHGHLGPFQSVYGRADRARVPSGVVGGVIVVGVGLGGSDGGYQAEEAASIPSRGSRTPLHGDD